MDKRYPAGRWAILVALAFSLALFSCGDNHDDDDPLDQQPTGDDDTDQPGDDDDQPVPPSPAEPWDTFVEPWPQDTIEELYHDETPEPGLMRLKAQEYDAWHEQHHQPFYGSTVGVFFTDANRTQVRNYFDFGDSSLWTGTYLASQALRYGTTGDPQAKANAIRIAKVLSGHLHITGRQGFIARYRGPQDLRVMPSNCADDCHQVNEGEFGGDFWYGDTSRDQYTGWIFGMLMAYDLIDDEPTREMISADVEEVLDELIRSEWVIIDVDGRRTGPSPTVLTTQQLTWSLIGYHLTGKGAYKRMVQHWILDEHRKHHRLSAFNFFNRYNQYFGNNLGHEMFYCLLRLGKAYLNEPDYLFFREMFDTTQHSFARLSHNAFFNGVHMSQGIYTPADDDPYQTQLLEDLSDFRPAPNYTYAVQPPDAELDPISIILSDILAQYPILEEMLGGIEPQAIEAYPVYFQCSTDYLWQRNPFRINCSYKEDLTKVQPGVDYLTAYWLASYYQFISKDL